MNINRQTPDPSYAAGTRSRRSLLMLPMAILMLMALAVMARGSHSGDWDREAAIRKADYAYIQACGAAAMDSNDLAYRLFARAHELNPQDQDIALMYAQTRAGSRLDSASLEQFYRAMMNRVMSSPDDYLDAAQAAIVAKQLRRYDDLVTIYELIDMVWPQKSDASELAAAYISKSLATGDSAAYDKAMAIFDRLERGVGTDVGLTSQRVRAMSSRGDTAGMLAELDRLVKHLPNEIDALVYAGGAYYELGRDSLAGESLRRACLIDSTDSRAVMSLAQYYTLTGDSTRAQQQIIRAVVSPGVDADTKVDLLSVYIRSHADDTTMRGDIKTLFQRAIDVSPGEPRLHAAFGSYLAMCDDLDGRIEQFGYALALDPTDDDLRSGYIQVLAEANDSARLIEVARKGMEISPANFYYPIMAASALDAGGHHAEAVRLMDSVEIGEVKNNKAVSSFLTVKADMYQRIDSINAALELYERAIKLNPDNYMAYNNASYAMAVNDIDLDRALRYARYAVLSDVNNPTYLDTYAWAYFKLKNYPEAKSYIDKALEALDYTGIAVTDTAATDTIAEALTARHAPAANDSTIVIDISAPAGVTGADAAASDSATIDSTEPEDDIEVTVSYAGMAEVLEHAGDIYFMSGFPDRAVEFWEAAAREGDPSELLKRKIKNKTFFYK